jgi:SAM-dependent methyltransferase
MQELGTDRDFVVDQYSDAAKLRIRIETHQRYSHGDTDRILDDATQALHLSPGLRMLDVGCGAGGWHARATQAGARLVGVDLMHGMVREARLAGADLQPTPLLCLADAQALPFSDATFDRVLCAGVLYHVADCERALREIRRILRPGGRTVISTNGAFAMRRIYELHSSAARQLGFDPLPITSGHFTMDDLPLVQRVFPTAERYILEGALVFEASEPALSFYASNRIDALRDAPRDGSHRPRLLPAMRERIDEIIEREGSFTVAKSVGYFVATADASLREPS